jgi:tetratricopeptide (TPR) repeat protein
MSITKVQAERGINFIMSDKQTYWELSIEKYENGNYEEALENINKSIELDNYEPLTHQIRGRIKTELKQYQSALEDFDKAIKLVQKGKLILFLNKEQKELISTMYREKSVAYRNLGEYKQALESSNKAIGLNTKNVFAYYSRGHANRSLKQYIQALKDFDEVIKLLLNKEIEEDKDDCEDLLFYSYLWKSRIYYSGLRKYEKAIESLDKCLELDPNNAEVNHLRGSCIIALNYDSTEELNKALWYLNNAQNSFSQPEAETYYALGQTYLKLEKYAEAINCFDSAIELKDKLARYYFLRSKCKVQLNQGNEAIEDLNKTIELDNQWEEAYWGRGLCKFGLEQYKESIEDFEKALALGFETDESYYSIAMSYYELKNYTSAILKMSKAIELSVKEDSSLLYGIRGLCKMELKQYKEAIKDFNKVMELDKDASDAYSARAKCECELLLYEEAIKDYEKAYELSQTPIQKIGIVLELHSCLEEVNTLQVEEALNLCDGLSTDKTYSTLKCHCLLLLKREYELILEITLDILQKRELDLEKREDSDKSEEIHGLLIETYLRLKDYSEAEKWATKYTEIRPKEAEPFIVLLWIYAEQKQKDKVQELLVICNQKDKDWQKRRQYKEIVVSLDKLSE